MVLKTNSFTIRTQRNIMVIVENTVSISPFAERKRKCMTYYAHSVDGKPAQEWHRLEEHLSGTAKLASQFADEFGCGEWGYLAGLWHDLGKY